MITDTRVERMEEMTTPTDRITFIKPHPNLPEQRSYVSKWGLRRVGFDELQPKLKQRHRLEEMNSALLNERIRYLGEAIFNPIILIYREGGVIDIQDGQKRLQSHYTMGADSIWAYCIYEKDNPMWSRMRQIAQEADDDENKRAPSS